MLPDPDNPLFYVYAEGDTDYDDANGSGDVSENLVDKYADLVESLIKSD
jgi:hypothetical protein